MSKQARRKKKQKNKRKKEEKKRQADHSPPDQIATPVTVPTNPNKSGRGLSVSSIILTAVFGLIGLIGLIITFFPRLSSSAASPADSYDVLGSSRFTINNDGFFRVTDVVSACYIWRGFGPGRFLVGDTLVQLAVPPEKRLRPTEGYTVPCAQGVVQLDAADLAIVVSYRVWPVTVWKRHEMFRFVSRSNERGQVVWDKQPLTEDMEHDFDKFIARFGGEFPPPLPTIESPIIHK